MQHKNMMMMKVQNIHTDNRQHTCNQRIHGGVFALWELYHRHLGDILMGIDVRKCH